MNYIKTLKGGSLSTTVVISDGQTKFVRKSISKNIEREYGLVRWQSQIRKLQNLNKHFPDSSISILKFGVINDCFYYDIPFYENSLNCFDALIAGESVELMVDKISQLLFKMARIEYGITEGALSVYICEEILSPLNLAQKLLYQNKLQLSENESILFETSLNSAIKKTNYLIGKLDNVKVFESLTHGNLTLENILWDNESKNLIMIDPYGETYCETIMGDVSQLLQSSASGYEYLSALFENLEIGIDNYPLKKIPRCLQLFSDLLIDKIREENWYSEEQLILLRSSQFTRMFPFKIVNNPRNAVIFMMHGINLLENLKC